MEDALYKLIWYPLITFCTFFATAMHDTDELIYEDTGANSSYTAAYFGHVLPITHGFFVCCAYFGTNNDVFLVLKELINMRGFPDDEGYDVLMKASAAAWQAQTNPPRQVSSRSRSASNTPTSNISNPLGLNKENAEDENNM